MWKLILITNCYGRLNVNQYVYDPSIVQAFSKSVLTIAIVTHFHLHRKRMCFQSSILEDLMQKRIILKLLFSYFDKALS